MNLITNDAFIEETAKVYFNENSITGIPYYQIYSFEQFLIMRAENA